MNAVCERFLGKDKLRQIMAGLSHQSTHTSLPDVFEKLGLREVPIEGTASKNDRMKAAFAQVSDEDLPALAERYIALFNPKPGERNELQELLWKHASGPKVPERYRRDVARCLSTEDLRTRGFMDLLESLWVLDKLSYPGPFGHPKTLREEVARHVMHDPDYEPEDVFELVGAYPITHGLVGMATAKPIPVRGMYEMPKTLDRDAYRGLVHSWLAWLLKRADSRAGASPVVSVERAERERSIVEEAFAGDVIGIYDPGVFEIGDTCHRRGRSDLRGDSELRARALRAPRPDRPSAAQAGS